jgi:ribosomal protein S20
MLKGRRRWLALGALAGVLAVGAGAGFAATGGADNGFLSGVAKRLGISEDKLRDAIADETIARIDQAVRDGDITEEQGERLKERARSGEGLGRLGLGRGFGLDPLPFPGPDLGRGFGRVFKAAGDQLEAAAEYLGVTRAELMEELSDGDSLADVARQKGKSVEGLKTAMRNALEADLDEAVADDVITREHADRLYEKLAPQIDRLVEQGLPVPKPFGFGFGGGEVFEAAADYLGLTEAQLRDELSDGDSLADVAGDRGKSVEGLKTAMRNALKADLDEAVEKGALTREHADEMLEELSDILDDAVDGDVRGFGFRLKFGGRGGMEFGFDGEAGFPGILPVPEPAIVEDARSSVF